MKTKNAIEHNDLTAQTEDRAEYAVQREINATATAEVEDVIIARALEILARRMRSTGVLMDAPPGCPRLAPPAGWRQAA